MAAVVDAGPVDDEQHLAAVEAVDEAWEGGAIWAGHGLQGEVDFWGEGWVLRVEDCGGLDAGVPGEAACGAARGGWEGEGVCVVGFHGEGVVTVTELREEWVLVADLYCVGWKWEEKETNG